MSNPNDLHKGAAEVEMIEAETEVELTKPVNES